MAETEFPALPPEVMNVSVMETSVSDSMPKASETVAAVPRRIYSDRDLEGEIERAALELTSIKAERRTQEEALQELRRQVQTPGAGLSDRRPVEIRRKVRPRSKAKAKAWRAVLPLPTVPPGGHKERGMSLAYYDPFVAQYRLLPEGYEPPSAKDLEAWYQARSGADDEEWAQRWPQEMMARIFPGGDLKIRHRPMQSLLGPLLVCDSFSGKTVEYSDRIPLESRAPSRPGTAQRFLRLLEDPEYQELQHYVEAFDDMSAQEQEAAGEWQQELCHSMRKLLDEASKADDPAFKERQVRAAYQLYHRQCYEQQRAGHQHENQQSRSVPDDLRHAPGVDVGLNANLDRTLLPGSSFYIASSYRDPDFDDGDDGQPLYSCSSGGNHARGVTLPPAKERLQHFETHRIVSPEVARRLKEARDREGSPEPLDGTLTPSTNTGGYPTSQSAASGTRSRPVSAIRREIAGATAASANMTMRVGTALQGPPARAIAKATTRSAEKGAAPSSLARPRLSDPEVKRTVSETRRPSSAVEVMPHSPAPMPLPQKTTPGEAAAASASHTELRGKVTEEVADAIERMEERWLEKRHREVSAQILGEEQRAAIQQWADCRARVEEEIAHNIEANRCQAAAAVQRDYELPAEAYEDVEPSVPPSQSAAAEATFPGASRHEPRLAYALSPARKAQQQRPHSAVAGSRAALASTAPAQKAEVTFRESFDEEKKPRPLSARIGRLRQLHAKLLRPSHDDFVEFGQDEDGSIDVGPVRPFFETPEATGHMTLSAYTCGGEGQPAAVRLDDDIDVLAASCDLWQSKHSQIRARGLGGSSSYSNLHEMRKKQLTEVEDIVQAFARKDCPLDEQTVARFTEALTCPEHRIRTCPGGKLFNNIPPGLPVNPFAAEVKPQRKRKGRKPRPASSGQGQGQGLGFRTAPALRVRRPLSAASGNRRP